MITCMSFVISYIGQYIELYFFLKTIYRKAIGYSFRVGGQCTCDNILRKAKIAIGLCPNSHRYIEKLALYSSRPLQVI